MKKENEENKEAGDIPENEENKVEEKPEEKPEIKPVVKPEKKKLCGRCGHPMELNKEKTTWICTSNICSYDEMA